MWAADGSAGAEAALEVAKGLAEPRARIVAAHCTELLTGRAMGMLADPEDASAVGRVRARVEELVAEGFDADLVVRRSHLSPAEIVAGVAEEEHAELIVCGTRGHGVVAGALMGSVSQRLPHVARVPVLIVPTPERRPVEEPERAAVHAEALRSRPTSLRQSADARGMGVSA